MAEFELNNAGLIALCKGPEMHAALQEQASRIAMGANASANAYSSKFPGMRNPSFLGTTQNLDRTAIGVVYPCSPLGNYAQSKDKVLSRQVH